MARRKLLAAAGFHQLDLTSPGANLNLFARAGARETVYLAGLSPPGTHNSGVALVR